MARNRTIRTWLACLALAVSLCAPRVPGGAAQGVPEQFVQTAAVPAATATILGTQGGGPGASHARRQTTADGPFLLVPLHCCAANGGSFAALSAPQEGTAGALGRDEAERARPSSRHLLKSGILLRSARSPAFRFPL